jgi:aryl-alcohol dehydrogenase-like predicted oxidoreductase
MNGQQIMREIGRSGVAASAVGLGTWAIGGWMWGGTDERESVAAVQASLDAGVTLIDTAPAYGLGRAEEIVGKALSRRRDKAVIATKCGLVWHTRQGNHFFDQDGRPVHRHLGRESIFHEVEQSLRRLGTDYIDLYITHWQDPTTAIEETMRALEDLRAAGKIRAIGASNVNLEELEIYVKIGGLDAIQERFSMLDREIEAQLLPVTTANGSGDAQLFVARPGASLRLDRAGTRLFRRRPAQGQSPFLRRKPGEGHAFRRSDKADRAGARGIDRPDRHRLDPGAARHHLRALRRAQSRPGARQCRSRHDPAQRGGPLGNRCCDSG